MISGTRYRLTLEINRQTRLAQEIARAQAEISSQKKILAPSDDPIGAARVSQIAQAQANEEAWLRNLSVAEGLAARANNNLTSIATALDRANELMLSARNETYSASDRAVFAQELRGIADDVASLMAARDDRGEPLFRSNAELQIPVSAGITLSPVAGYAALFEGIPATAGPAALGDILRDAADAVEIADAAARAAAITTSLDDVQAGQTRIRAARSDQGVRAARIDSIVDRLEESKITLAGQRIDIEGVDMPEAIARMQSRDLSLKAAQAIFANVNQSTLFDLLR